MKTTSTDTAQLDRLRNALATPATDEAAAASLHRSTMPKLAMAAISSK